MLTIDHRERPSGIPDILIKKGVQIDIVTLKVGDYCAGDDWLVERKTATDFIQSLISGRLFTQCASLTRSGKHPLLLLEGDPYQTAHHIDTNAVKGALLSVTASWQIPIIHTADQEDTAEHLLMLMAQSVQRQSPIRLNGYKSRRIKTQRLRFLQALPGVGSMMAKRLCQHFGSLREVMAADEKMLLEVKGLGKKGAKKILDFLEMDDQKRSPGPD